MLPKGYPVIEDAAQLLCVSPRSLQRLLNEEGVSYSDLVDRCRCNAACESLAHTQRPIKDIAAALGYSDPTHFSRAFRRIAGTNPKQYRQAYSRHCSKDALVADYSVDLSHTGH